MFELVHGRIFDFLSRAGGANSKVKGTILLKGLPEKDNRGRTLTESTSHDFKVGSSGVKRLCWFNTQCAWELTDLMIIFSLFLNHPLSCPTKNSQTENDRKGTCSWNSCSEILSDRSIWLSDLSIQTHENLPGYLCRCVLVETEGQFARFPIRLPILIVSRAFVQLV